MRSCGRWVKIIIHLYSKLFTQCVMTGLKTAQNDRNICRAALQQVANGKVEVERNKGRKSNNKSIAGS